MPKYIMPYSSIILRSVGNSSLHISIDRSDIDVRLQYCTIDVRENRITVNRLVYLYNGSERVVFFICNLFDAEETVVRTVDKLFRYFDSSIVNTDVTFKGTCKNVIVV